MITSEAAADQMIVSGETVRIAGIIRESIVDGPGLRFTVFFQGCPHRCKGCHNESTHDFHGGYDCELSNILTEIDKNPLLSGVTFSGGEPFCQPKEFYKLGIEIKARGLDIVAYSGYTLEELQRMAKKDKYIEKLLEIIDYLVDGPFILEEKDLTLEFRGSRNQRFIRMSDIRE
ncbi:MAG TPA: anaerobic ribonucleoside-triphosphate reductase activating protein [Anaerovoracaceae bacterium]|nr:anaerobic ribonucleoside-triphosphate reductase activating protein [Anaerovoracaceae bacterium]